MSYVQLLTAGEDGQLKYGPEYRNAYGFAGLIWDALGERYAGKIVEKTGKHWSSTEPVPLWEWADAEKLPAHEANALVLTYDRAFIRGREQLQHAANSLALFDASNFQQYVNHLLTIARDLSMAVANGAVYAAFYGHSGGENLFSISPPTCNDERHCNVVCPHCAKEIDLPDPNEEDSHLLSFKSESDVAGVAPLLYTLVDPRGEPVSVGSLRKEASRGR